jgi:hydrogenase nickel incorporation protein HypA/HybF
VHELALADAIVAIAEQHARGRRVARVELDVGYLRQVVPDALRFAFELVAEGTCAEGAELAIDEVPATVLCGACGADTRVDAFPLACARCGSVDVEIAAGEEFSISALELEDAPVAVARR